MKKDDEGTKKNNTELVTNIHMIVVRLLSKMTKPNQI